MLPKGRVSYEPVMNFDLFTTCVEMAGAVLPSDRPIDGKNLTSVLEGGKSRHEALFFYFLDNLNAVRMGEWKFHRPHRFWSSSFFYAKKGPMLFNVVEDPYESYNLIDKHPGKARELAAVMDEWEQITS